MIEFVGAIVKVLCDFASEVMISEMVRLIEMGPWGLYNEFDCEYYQNDIRNEFLDQKNIGLAIVIEIVGAII